MSKGSQNRHLEIKRAGFHELFFDLIFVYAIQKIAHVILHAHHGSVSGDLFFKYIMMSLILWILWSHQTFFTNRFGDAVKKDVIFMMVNMFILIFLSNSLYPSFEKTFTPFFFCVALMYLSIGLQYFIHMNNKMDEGDKKTCQSFTIVALTVSALTFISLILPSNIHYIPAFIGVFIAATGLIPFRKYLYQSPVNMMHLVERYSLLTIIIFGEVIVGLGSIFKINHFNVIYIFQFMIIVGLFGLYWLITEYYIDEKQKSIGFRLVYTHLLINIALGMLNSAIVFSGNHELHPLFEINLMYISVLLFFVGVWLNAPYFHQDMINIKHIVYSIIILVISYIISLIFISITEVMVVSITIAVMIVMYIYYKNKDKTN